MTLLSCPISSLHTLKTLFFSQFHIKISRQTFRRWCDKAGLPPHCTPHGVRKATTAYLAEKGCTDHEIMAITGHRSLSEVQRYTQKARRSVLADSAMAKFKR